MLHKLAIVIPAYKGKFLAETLNSIARQDCKSFSLYIGDDCSPEDLGSIVEKYKNSIDITYHKFSTNIGKTDLLAHWERCIAMTEEPFLHFFSDDDIMPPDTVSRALSYLERFPEYDIFRFPLDIIDEKSRPLYTNPGFAHDTSPAEDLLIDKLSCKRASAAVEYVFTRRILNHTGGFVKFPLAWCSDDATWYLMARQKGIVNIKGSAISWRNVTGYNISNDNRLNREKITATAEFLQWLDKNYKGEKNAAFRRAVSTYIRTILQTSVNRDYSNKELIRLCKASYKLTGMTAYRIFFENFIKKQ